MPNIYNNIWVSSSFLGQMQIYRAITEIARLEPLWSIVNILIWRFQLKENLSRLEKSIELPFFHYNFYYCRQKRITSELLGCVPAQSVNFFLSCDWTNIALPRLHELFLLWFMMQEQIYIFIWNVWWFMMSITGALEGSK